MVSVCCWQGPASSFSRCTYPPIFCTAGKLNELFNKARTLSAEGELQSLSRRERLELQLHQEVANNFEMCEAMIEFVELTRWLLGGLLGPRHAVALQRVFASLNAFVANGQVLDVLIPGNLPKLSAAVVDLAKATLTIKLAP